MPIDTSVYSMIKPVDIAGSIEKGLSLRDMADQRVLRQKAQQELEQTKAAYKAGVVQNPDGSTSIDPGKTLSALSSVNPAEAQKYQTQQMQNKKQQMEQHAQELTLVGQTLSGVNDSQGWEAAKSNLEKNGVDISQYKNVPYDPKLKDSLLGQALTYKDQLANKIAQQNADRTQQHEKTYEQEVGARRDANTLQRQKQTGEQVDKLGKDFKKDLDPDSSKTGNFGKISARVQQADYLKGLIGSFRGGNLPSAQMEELGMGMANMISGAGGSSRAQVEAIVPKTALGDASHLVSWLTSEPMGAQQQKFVEMMDHTIDRERGIANDQLNNIRSSRLSAHSLYKRLAPDQYNAQMKSYGMDPATGKSVSNGGASAGAHPQDSQAVQWAKSNPNDPRAAQILQLNDNGQ